VAAGDLGGEVGEIVVTVLDLDRPLIRYALGDLTAALPGGARIPGRTISRISPSATRRPGSPGVS
jgi:phenylacetate-coenzyme A ligase PaaK-like adenylate-forming protein